MKIDFSKVVTLAQDELAQKVGLERGWRDAELARADTQLMKVQDGVTGIGTQKAWREYRNELRDWPSSKSFPNVRPVAPDAK